MNLPFTVNLEGKTAAVTGGGGILCGAFARALAACGASVAILDLKEEAAGTVADTIIREGGKASAYAVDVLDEGSLSEARGRIEKDLGICDILINGAGGNHPRGTTTREYMLSEDLVEKNPEIVTFFDLDPEGIKFVFNLNFLGTLLPSQVFTRHLVKGDHSTIINVSSMNAILPLTKIPAYSGAKAAVSNFTQWLAVHLSRMDIRVNAMAPGFFLTDQNRTLLIKEDGAFTERADKIIKQTPMRRFGEPEELIGTLLWLADHRASGFVNGTVIPVDGGFSAYSGV